MDTPAHRPVLHGHGVTLRPVHPGDAEALLAATLDPENMRLTGTHAMFTIEQVRRHYESVANAQDRFDFAITRSDDPQSRWLGEAVLRNVDRENRSAGFRISLAGQAHYGQGLGSAAIGLLLDFAFGPLALHRVELEVYDFDPRARHVYEKLGFVVEGLRRDALWWEGAWHDAVSMALLESEWSTARDRRGS
ncbi:MAG: GNAT family N-acetyltransferase [Rubrivivax sp.]|nr:GNAT family N-acetyltransferase [Rubrivivax sp.]